MDTNSTGQTTQQWEEQVDRGIELLKLCYELQSKKDGVDRVALFGTDKTKIWDEFSLDIENAIINMASLRDLIPQNLKLADLGRKLEADGKILMTAGDDYSIFALNYVCSQHEV
jgi:hypothetical protein